MKTLARFSVESILPHIGLGCQPVELNGWKVKTNSSRLECFKRNQKCVWCQRAGNVFLLQQHVPGIPRFQLNCFLENCPWCALRSRHSNGHMPHLNLYHLSKAGSLLLMTQDHIFPQWAGGSSDQDNLQTMCSECNQRKGGDIPKHLKNKS